LRKYALKVNKPHSSVPKMHSFGRRWRNHELRGNLLWNSRYRLSRNRHVLYAVFKENGTAIRALTVDEIVKEAEEAVTSGRNTEKARRLFGQMEFPLKEITEIILEESKRTAKNRKLGRFNED